MILGFPIGDFLIMQLKLLKWASIILIVFLGILAYSNSFHCSFQFDDESSIFRNQYIENIHDISSIWNFLPRRFVLYLSLALNYHFCKYNVFGYHLVNLAIHLLTAFLVWWLVLLTLSTACMKKNKISQHADLVALFAALIFVSHPVQTEAVTYLVQRAASLATLFYLAALCFYVKSRLLQDNKAYSLVFYGASILTAVVAMFTKEIAITLPLMIMFYDWSFLRTDRKFNWKRAAPFLLTLLIIPLTMYFTESLKTKQMPGIVPPESPAISTIHYLLTEFKVICTYIRLIFLPVNQNLDYDYRVSYSIFELPVLFSLAFLLAVFYFIQRLFSEYRLVAFYAAWFFITLLPESSLLPINDVIFEHRLYLPMVGGSILLASSVFYLLREKSIKTSIIILAILVSYFSILTYQRNKVWKDEFTLWSDVVKKSPHKARPYNNLGKAYFDRDDWDQARANFNKSIELDPNYAEPYYNRGTVYARQGNFVMANADFTKALERRPGYVDVYNNRACAYISEGKFAQAILDFNNAIKINPNNAEDFNELGYAYEKLGDFNQAFEYYNKALQLDPNLEQAYINLGVAYENKGDFTQAILADTKAIGIDPRNAQYYYNRGNANIKGSHFIEAITDFKKAIDINPNFGDAYFNLGCIYSFQNQFTQAIFCYTKAIGINPRNKQAYKYRAIAHFKLKDFKNAFTDADKLKELNNSATP